MDLSKLKKKFRSKSDRLRDEEILSRESSLSGYDEASFHATHEKNEGATCSSRIGETSRIPKNVCDQSDHFDPPGCGDT